MREVAGKLEAVRADGLLADEIDNGGLDATDLDAEESGDAAARGVLLIPAALAAAPPPAAAGNDVFRLDRPEATDRRSTRRVRRLARETTSGRLRRRRCDVDRRRAERRPVDVAAVIATVPTARDDIFAHPMDWSTYTTAEIDAVASKWISKKLTDLLGESEPALARFVLEKLDARVSPLDLIVDLDPVLDAECEPFVISLWRLLIFEINKATMSS